MGQILMINPVIWLSDCCYIYEGKFTIINNHLRVNYTSKELWFLVGYSLGSIKLKNNLTEHDRITIILKLKKLGLIYDH